MVEMIVDLIANPQAKYPYPDPDEADVVAALQDFTETSVDTPVEEKAANESQQTANANVLPEHIRQSGNPISNAELENAHSDEPELGEFNRKGKFAQTRREFHNNQVSLKSTNKPPQRRSGRSRLADTGQVPI